MMERVADKRIFIGAIFVGAARFRASVLSELLVFDLVASRRVEQFVEDEVRHPST